MTIKAIQTVYKNYKFRSRLEARWAVFFDALGLEWEYEPEGFDLGDGVWYLPDFYLPSLKTWVEVKPVIHTDPESKVYLAGKVSKNCWRHSIFTPSINIGDDLFDWGESLSCLASSVITGPRFISCDHGCSHGAATHGMAESYCTDTSDFHSIGFEKLVYSACIDAISRSTDVFVWIDDLTCYATLAELGYAKAIGKKITVAVKAGLLDKIELSVSSSGKHELWFIEEMADRFFESESAVSAFKKSFKPSSSTWVEYSKIKSVADSLNENAMIVGGEPMLRNAFGSGSSIDGIYLNKLFDSAATKARQARFEHGETPL